MAQKGPSFTHTKESACSVHSCDTRGGITTVHARWLPGFLTPNRHYARLLFEPRFKKQLPFVIEGSAFLCGEICSRVFYFFKALRDKVFTLWVVKERAPITTYPTFVSYVALVGIA